MKQNYEAGRSMVEMLGTLAIIGVLSIGGIAGYSYGMDKYRANEIMNDIMLRSVDIIAQFDTTGDANIDSWSTTTAGKYTIGLETGGEYINGIQVDGLEKRLCEMVFDGMINQAAIKIGDTMYDSVTDNPICGDANTMVFYVDETGDWEEVTEKETEPETETITTEREEETDTTTTTTETEDECADGVILDGICYEGCLWNGSYLKCDDGEYYCPAGYYDKSNCPTPSCTPCPDGSTSNPKNRGWKNEVCYCMDNKYLWGSECLTAEEYEKLTDDGVLPSEDRSPVNCA